VEKEMEGYGMNRKNVWMAAALAVLAVWTGEARAQAGKIRAEIPFAFQAGKHSLPAGSYLFDHMNSSPMLVITAPDGERIAMLTHPAGKVEAPPAPGLVFEREDGISSLVEVWAPGAAHRAGVQASRPKASVAAARQRVRIVASLATR
jgi:hypothetical protein